MEDHLVHNPTFSNLEKGENAELRFFCEAFSLLDSVSNCKTNLLLGFATRVRESKDGRLEWGKIPDLFPEDANAKPQNYLSAIKRVGDLVDQVVRKGWITPMRSRSLGVIALEAHKYHRNDAKMSLENNNKGSKRTRRGSTVVSKVAKVWEEMAIQMEELAKFQDENMSYHADFQKENYLPHPDSWKVYFSTFTFILIALVYSIVA